MAGAYTSLTLKHLAADKEVTLPVRVNNFTQDAKANFSSTEVYARMDPIFTYQNTVRSFQLTCGTPLYYELGKCATGSAAAHPMRILYDSLQKVAGGDASAAPAGDHEVASAMYSSFSVQALSTIYQFMYPVYKTEDHGAGIETHQLAGPPILQIQVPRVLNAPGGANASLIFVPETFNITTGLANASEVQMTITGPGDLKYLAPVGGFGFTIGGTILHQDFSPGFVYSVSGEGKDKAVRLNFTKTKFPFGATATYNAKKILE